MIIGEKNNKLIEPISKMHSGRNRRISAATAFLKFAVFSKYGSFLRQRSRDEIRSISSSKPFLRWVLIFFGTITVVLLFYAFILGNIIFAADGSGTNSVSPNSVLQGSFGNTLNFSLVAEETMDSGEFSIGVPAGWSAPQGLPNLAGYTEIVSENGGITAKVEDSADSTNGWFAGSACSGGLFADSIVKREGGAAIKCVNGNERVNDVWHKNISSENWSGYSHAAFWIRSTASIPSPQLRFAYDNNANLSSPIEEIAFGQTIPANTWTYVILSFRNTNRGSINSFGFVIRTNAGLDNQNVWIDDVLLGPSAPDFSAVGNIKIRILKLSAGQGFSVIYGSGGGTNGVVAPEITGDYVFLTKSRNSDSGELVPIAASPVVAVLPIIQKRFFSTVVFSGRAFPGAELSATAQDGFMDVVIKKETVKSPAGDFEIRFDSVPLASEPRSFALVGRDKDGRLTQVKIFNVQTLAPLIISDIIMSPTLGLVKSAASRGDFLNIVGYAAPLSKVELEIDSVKKELVSDENGFYNFLFDTKIIPVGNWTARAIQTDKYGKKSDFSLSKTFVIHRFFNPQMDFNNDGIIDISDWSIFLSLWNSPGAADKIDLNGDGKVDVSDFSILLSALKKIYD